MEEQGTAFQTEEGFEFENEAKLLQYEINSIPGGFSVELTWRVHPNHSRKRVIRVLNRMGNDQTILDRIPVIEDLNSICGKDGVGRESFIIDLAKLEGEYETSQLCIDVYFWAPEIKKTRVLNFPRATRIVLPLNEAKSS